MLVLRHIAEYGVVGFMIYCLKFASVFMAGYDDPAIYTFQVSELVHQIMARQYHMRIILPSGYLSRSC